MKMPVTLLAVVAMATLASCQRESAPAPAMLPDIEVSFELTDEFARPVSADRYGGRLRLVFFGYTTCPDICPITLHNIATALRSLGNSAQRVTVLFISVDPKRDTPDRLRQYTDAFHPSIIGLTGTYDQILAVTANFRTTFGYSLSGDGGHERPLSRDDYEALPATVSYIPYHGSQVYVVGANDELLDIIGYGSTSAQIENTLRTYIDQSNR